MGEIVLLSGVISPNIVILVMHRHLISYHMRIPVNR